MIKHQKPVTAVLCGAGTRGRDSYGKYALKYPEKLQFIAIAEPRTDRRKLFQKEHSIPENRTFHSWEELLSSKMEKIADVAFICTQDRMHFEPAMRAIELGYDILLEKPISPNINECKELKKKIEQKGCFVQVSHVLRYTQFWQKIKQIVESGEIGKIIDYDHSENISFWHFGHSYVRGVYQSENDSSPIILAKTCHDLDLMVWILGKTPISVQSMGKLTFYQRKNAPKGSPEYCTDGCSVSESCPWYSPRLYLKGEPIIRSGLHSPKKIERTLTKLALEHPKRLHIIKPFRPEIESILNWDQWPTTMLTTDFSQEAKIHALTHSRYDKCIFKCDNNVLDHQIATFQFDDGITATLRLHGFSDLEGREIRIFGTKGVIRGWFRFNEQKIIVRDFRYSNEKCVFHKGIEINGHGGGDEGLMNHFVKIIQHRRDNNIGKKKLNEFKESFNRSDLFGALESHFMAFAVEDARKTKKTVFLENYRS